MDKKKSIIVTGASRGLGRYIVEDILNKTEYEVVSISRNGYGENSYGERLVDLKFDITDITSIPALINEISSTSNIYACINNAGIGTNSILPTQHDKEIEKVITCNLTAPILISKYVSRQMLKRREGKIINIASVVAHTGYNGLATYASTKSGLIGFTKSLARELGSANISVNSISPGFMKTDMTSSLGSRMEQIKRRSPVNQLPELSDVSEIILFLLECEHSRYTGRDFIVDAGNSI